MTNILKFLVCALALFATPALAQSFDDVGTDYSNASIVEWSEDSLNDYVKLADAFTCILSNARIDVLPNAKYEALISEVECGSSDETVNASNVSNRTTLSSSIFRNTRASNISNQESLFWFTGQDGFKFIAGSVIKQSAASSPPYGEWGISYYLNNWIENQGEEYTKDNTPAKGHVDIVAQANGGTLIKAYQWNQDRVQAARIEYSSSTLSSAKILGRETGVGIDEIVAAKTNATHVYRAKSTDGGLNFTGQCMKRDSTWKTGYRYGVYNSTTGARVSLAGAFNFKYTEGGSNQMGHLGSWGVQFYDPAAAFSPINTTKNIISQEDDKPYTLSWSPGRLWQTSAVSEALPSSGTSYFKKYVNNGGYVDMQINNTTLVATFWDSAGNAITDPYDNLVGDNEITQSDITANTWLGHNIYSEEKRTNITWDGTGNIKFFKDSDASTYTDLLAPVASARYTTLYAIADRAAGSNLPVDAAAWRSDANPSGHTEKASSADDTYYFTAMIPPDGKLSRTLYTDPTGDGPSAEDKAVMFNFSANYKDKTYTTFHSTPITASLKKGGSGSDKDDISPWPRKSLYLSSVDAASRTPSSTLYQWNFGAFSWNNSIIAIKADGTIYTTDKPMTLKYLHAASKDMNENKTIVYYADFNNNPMPALCPLNAGTPMCTISPTLMGTKEYYLRYDGKWLSGLPSTTARASVSDTNGFWLNMINPEAGTPVTHTAGGVTTNYVLKPLQIGEAFLNEPIGSNCDAIDFNSVAEFGWSLADLPALADYPLPTATWGDRPTRAELRCTVTMGDASSCD